MPPTQTFPPLDPLDEPPDELPPELDPPDDDEDEDDPDDDDEEPSPQNALRDRPHATSALAHAPSTQAAARYELPLEQSQHVGLHCAYVEHELPGEPVPFSFSGLDGQ